MRSTGLLPLQYASTGVEVPADLALAVYAWWAGGRWRGVAVASFLVAAALAFLAMFDAYPAHLSAFVLVGWPLALALGMGSLGLLADRGDAVRAPWLVGTVALVAEVGVILVVLAGGLPIGVLKYALRSLDAVVALAVLAAAVADYRRTASGDAFLPA